MSNMQPLFYLNEKHAKTQARFLTYTFQITAAKTVVAYPRGAEILPTFDALTQAQIDAYLGSTNEFLATQFDATAMGTDAFGGIINMYGQAGLVATCDVVSKTGTGLATIVNSSSFGPVSGLAASSLTAGVAVSSLGNIAFRGVLTGVDALTSGIITVTIKWIAA